jgi:hypothetical protein
MTFARYPGRRVRRGRPGLPGTDSLPAGWVLETEGRITALETAGISVATADLTDVGDISGITEGEYLSWDDTENEFVPTTLPTLTLDYDVAFPFDGAGAAITAKNWYDSMSIQHTCAIRGFTLASPGGGTAEVQLNKSTVGTFPTFTVISGSSLQRPKLSSGNIVQSFVLTGWTPDLTSNDILRITTIAGATSVYATLTLHMRRTLTLG